MAEKKKGDGGRKPLVGIRMDESEQAKLDRVAEDLASRGGGMPNRAAVFRLGIKLVDEGFALPMVGDLGAGRPRMEPPDDDGTTVRVDRVFPKEAVVYRVRGRSMVEDHILDGDYVIILRCDDPDNGKTVVAWLKDLGGTLKNYNRAKHQIESGSGRGRWIRRLGDDDLILGYMVGLIRKY